MYTTATRPGRSRHLLISTVAYKTQMDYRTNLALDRALSQLAASGWQIGRSIGGGGGDVPGARNIQFAMAYASECSHLLFIDADVSWEAGTLERFLSHDVDLLVGVYPARAQDAPFPVRTLPGKVQCVDPHTRAPKADGLIEISAGPGGFMLISRRCMEQMVDAYSEDWYREKELPSGKAWNLFEFAVRDHERFGEDIHFCLQYGRIGGTVWCDPHLVLHHHGDATYSGSFLAHLKDIGRLVEGI